jgi:hypothetical protein
MPDMKHIVLMKFKPATSTAQIAGFFRDLKALKTLIPGIKDFVGGPYSSAEGLNQGYTHGFVMTFVSAAARDVYLPHGEHEKVKNAIIPHVEAIVAFDFEA